MAHCLAVQKVCLKVVVTVDLRESKMAAKRELKKDQPKAVKSELRMARRSALH